MAISGKTSSASLRLRQPRSEQLSFDYCCETDLTLIPKGLEQTYPAKLRRSCLCRNDRGMLLSVSIADKQRLAADRLGPSKHRKAIGLSRDP
jgi:hypothetical protein